MVHGVIKIIYLWNGSRCNENCDSIKVIENTLNILNLKNKIIFKLD